MMLSMEMTRLIERCKQGDAEALGELYKAYAQKMRGVCRRYVDEQVVDDVLHDAFVIIFTSFDRLRDVRKAESWILSITRNVASKYKDHQNAIPTVPLESAATMPASEEESTVRGIPLDKVMQALNRLPEGYANVFRLSVFEGLSHKEIATLLGIEPHSSSSQLTRAKKQLQKLLARYWMWLLLPLLLPVVLYFFKKDETTEEQKPMGRKREHQPSPQVVASPVHHPVIASTTYTNTNMIKHGLRLDTISTPALRPLPRISLDTPILTTALSDTFTFVIPEQGVTITPKKKRPWSTILAYVGLPSTGMKVVDNFLTVMNYVSSDTSSEEGDNPTGTTRIYNWGEYIDYMNSRASQLDSVEAADMRRVASLNAGPPDDPISERKYHERPRTFELSLNCRFNDRLNLTTGLSYTQMKSTFEIDGQYMLTRRTQKLNYVGLPIKLTYTLMSKNRWQLYTSGGVQLEIPVRGKETTQYLYAGPYPTSEGTDSLVLPTSHRSVQVPWQWSVNIGAGVQYQLLPHVNAYFEPRLQYYIPTGSPVETYRTEHPFNFTVPFGLRFTW